MIYTEKSKNNEMIFYNEKSKILKILGNNYKIKIKKYVETLIVNGNSNKIKCYSNNISFKYLILYGDNNVISIQKNNADLFIKDLGKNNIIKRKKNSSNNQENLNEINQIELKEEDQNNFSSNLKDFKFLCISKNIDNKKNEKQNFLNRKNYMEKSLIYQNYSELSEFKFKDWEKYKNKKNELCCICLELFNDNDLVKQFSCKNHLYHKKCLFNWIKIMRNCPMCKKELI